MTKRKDELDETLERLSKRAALHQSHKHSALWSRVAANAQPAARTRNQGKFLPYAVRRQGYIGIVRCADYMRLLPEFDGSLCPDQDAVNISELWQKSQLFKPFVVSIDASQRVTKGFAFDWHSARFLLKRGQQLCVVQMIEEDSVDASKPVLELIQTKGLLAADGEPVGPFPDTHIAL